MEEIAVFIEKELCEELVAGHEIIDAGEGILHQVAFQQV